MNKNEQAFLEGGNYLSLATLKRSGDWVATPVWFAPEGNSYYVFSAGDAGKVKRLRNFSDVRIAPCNMRGGLLGEWHACQAAVLTSDADERTALKALRRKYGWQMWIGDVFSRITGKMNRRAYLRIDP